MKLSLKRWRRRSLRSLPLTPRDGSITAVTRSTFNIYECCCEDDASQDITGCATTVLYLMPVTHLAQLGAYVYLDGGAWDGADAENLQRVSGCGLLALFYGAAFTCGDFLSVNGDPGGEARPVRRSLLGENSVRRPEPVRLQSLLQERLPVTQLVGVDLCGVEDLIQRPEYQVPVYKVGPPDNGLYGIGDDRVVYHGALDHLLYALAPPYHGEKRLPYQMGPDPGEIPLQ